MKQQLINFYLCVKHLGLIDGYRYWKINKYYQTRPKEYAEFLFESKKRAILMKDKALIEWIEICEKHFDNWKKSGQINQ